MLLYALRVWHYVELGAGGCGDSSGGGTLLHAYFEVSGQYAIRTGCETYLANFSSFLSLGAVGHWIIRTPSASQQSLPSFDFAFTTICAFDIFRDRFTRPLLQG
jgi:hypothetical protein